MLVSLSVNFVKRPSKLKSRLWQIMLPFQPPAHCHSQKPDHLSTSLDAWNSLTILATCRLSAELVSHAQELKPRSPEPVLWRSDSAALLHSDSIGDTQAGSPAPTHSKHKQRADPSNSCLGPARPTWRCCDTKPRNTSWPMAHGRIV